MSKTIEKRIDLSDDKFALIKKVMSMVAFVAVCLSLIFVLIGLVPFRGRSMNVIMAANNLLEFVNIGRTSFLYTASCVVFSVFYFYVVVRILIDIIICIKNFKKWFSDSDDKNMRIVSRVLTFKANICVSRFLMLFAISYVISAYSFNLISLLGIAVLVLCAVAVNVAKGLIYKGELVDTFVVSLNKLVFMIAPLLLLVLARVQIVDAVNSGISLLMNLGSDTFSMEFMGQMFADSVLKPFFFFIAWIFLMVFNKQVSEGDFSGESSGRVLLIFGIVFLVAYVVIMGWANQYTDILKYFELIFGNAVFIATVAAVYLASWGCDSNLNDLPYRKVAAAEEESAQN